MLFTKQRKDVLLKSSRVIGKHVGFQMNRDIACKHGNLLKVGVAKRENFRWADLVQGT